jgi:uracil phosphoribosyltransferase
MADKGHKNKRSSLDSPAQPIGPNYREEAMKPMATVSKEVPFDNVHVLDQTPQLIALLR